MFENFFSLLWQGVKNDIASLCQPVGFIVLVAVAGIIVLWWTSGLARKRRG